MQRSPGAFFTRTGFIVRGLTSITAFSIPIVFAWLLSLTIPITPYFPDYALTQISADEPAELLSLFNKKGYHWPPQTAVPLLAIKRFPGNMNSLPVKQKKSVFFRALLPMVLAENARIVERRNFLKNAFTNATIPRDSITAKRIKKIAGHYAVAGSINDQATRERLLHRVDTVPPALVLAQAAIESGWGASRFAQQGNNLFGIWTWDKNSGLKPRRRTDNADHFVRVYDTIRDSIRSYLHNINSGHAYLELRRLRAHMRTTRTPLDAIVLAGALHNYSARGEEYVADVRNMIRYNELQRIQNATLTAE